METTGEVFVGLVFPVILVTVSLFAIMWMYGRKLVVVNTWLAMFITWVFWNMCFASGAFYLIINTGARIESVGDFWSCFSLTLIYGILFYIGLNYLKKIAKEMIKSHQKKSK
jgi:hypothetical protein